MRDLGGLFGGGGMKWRHQLSWHPKKEIWPKQKFVTVFFPKKGQPPARDTTLPEKKKKKKKPSFIFSYFLFYFIFFFFSEKKQRKKYVFPKKEIFFFFFFFFFCLFEFIILNNIRRALGWNFHHYTQVIKAQHKKKCPTFVKKERERKNSLEGGAVYFFSFWLFGHFAWEICHSVYSRDQTPA